MPETQNFVFDHRELATALVKQQSIHEGLWGIYIEFGIAGANISSDPNGTSVVPAAIVPVLKIGIQRFPKSNNLTVDAATVNPKPKRVTAKLKQVKK